MITNALLALTSEEWSEQQRGKICELEAHFHALRRLFTSKFGFAAFTSAPGFAFSKNIFRVDFFFFFFLNAG